MSAPVKLSRTSHGAYEVRCGSTLLGRIYSYGDHDWDCERADDPTRWAGSFRTRREAVAALVQATADARNLRDAEAEVSEARALRQRLERKYERKP